VTRSDIASQDAFAIKWRWRWVWTLLRLTEPRSGNKRVAGATIHQIIRRPRNFSSSSSSSNIPAFDYEDEDDLVAAVAAL